MTGRSFRLRLGALLVAVALSVSCGSSQPPESAPGTGTGETITGRERIGWDQLAADAAELSGFRYAIYVDGVRSQIADITCATTAGAAGFACTGRLPSMSPGTHVLEIAAFTNAGGVVEGERSAPLRVTVAGATTPAVATPLTDGESITTADGVPLTAELVADNFEDVVDMALAPDGRLLAAERSGRISVFTADDGRFRELGYTARADESLLTVALAPDFARSGHIFMIGAASGAFRLSRHRLLENQLIERMHILPDIPASSDPSAVLRFGPDARLYAAFDDGGSRDAAARLSDWRGKVLRLNPDGSTPDDQPAASPVFWSGVASPRGLDWSPDGGTLWMAELGGDRVERIRALVATGARPRRAGQRSYYVLPGTIGVSALAFHRGDGVPQFRGDLFIAAREAGYLLRVRFDEQEPTSPVASEKLLEGRIGSVRAVRAAPDGSLYFATDTAVWRLGIPNP